MFNRFLSVLSPDFRSWWVLPVTSVDDGRVAVGEDVGELKRRPHRRLRRLLAQPSGRCRKLPQPQWLSSVGSSDLLQDEELQVQGVGPE